MGDELKGKLDDIKRFVLNISDRMEHYVNEDNIAHEVIKSQMSSIEKKQEKMDDKMDAFFQSVDTLKDEISKMNINMATYNAQLGEHMRRTAVAEERLEKTESVITGLMRQQNNQKSEIEKTKIVRSTVLKTFAYIGGFAGFIYTILEIIDYFAKH